MPGLCKHLSDLNFCMDIYCSHDSSEIYEWFQVMSSLAIRYNFLLTLDRSVKYDYVIIPTDDDKNAKDIYDRNFPSVPVLTITHIRNKCRFENSLFKSIPIHGIGFPSFSPMYDGINLQLKQLYSKMSPLNIVVLGNQINRAPGFFDVLKNKISNFDKINVYVISRQEYNFECQYKNVFFYKGVRNKIMINFLEKADYVYYGDLSDRYKESSSACVPLSFSYLCRLLTLPHLNDQYKLHSSLLLQDKPIELEKLSLEDIQNVNNEKQHFLLLTKNLLSIKLNF